VAFTVNETCLKSCAGGVENVMFGGCWSVGGVVSQHAVRLT
jgi:hypothetical protein